MKAMLYADWMNFRQSLRTIVLIMAFCLIWTAATGEPMMFSIMLVSASYLFPNTVFGVEQTSGWNKLSLSMPVLRRDVVASRFLLSLAVNAAMLACGLVFSAVFCMLVHTMLVHTETTLAECIGAALGGEAVALVLLGAQMAAAFKWGIQKSGYVLLGAFALIMLIPVSFFAVDRLDIAAAQADGLRAWLAGLSDASALLLLLGCVLAALAVYAICCLISVRIYRKKEL